MAADWIKMRTDLQTHPKVVRILSALCPQGVRGASEKYRVIGGLHAVWAVFDAHTTDGILRGYTPELLDNVIGWEGFSRAMESVGWLTFDGLETLALPEFEAHNGQSAKRRGEDQKRKKNCRQSVRILSAKDVDKNRTREEERREEIKAEDRPAIADPSPAAPDDPPTAAGAKRVVCPHKAIIALYHEVLPELRQVREWNETRQSLLARRWVESRERQSLDWWREFFGYVRQSKFLMGRTTGREGRAFDCDLEWLVRPTNFAKVLEGKYEDGDA